MNQAIFNQLSAEALTLPLEKKNRIHAAAKNLSEAEINKEYVIKNVITDEPEIINFLFTLGCFKGESLTLISILSENYIITVKDARYSIDADLAKAITLA